MPGQVTTHALTCRNCEYSESTSNLAISLLRLDGHTKIAATIRKVKYDTPLLPAILGLKNPS